MCMLVAGHLMFPLSDPLLILPSAILVIFVHRPSDSEISDLSQVHQFSPLSLLWLPQMRVHTGSNLTLRVQSLNISSCTHTK